LIRKGLALLLLAALLTALMATLLATLARVLGLLTAALAALLAALLLLVFVVRIVSHDYSLELLLPLKDEPTASNFVPMELPRFLHVSQMRDATEWTMEVPRIVNLRPAR
jgi:hypothetical protein